MLNVLTARLAFFFILFYFLNDSLKQIKLKAQSQQGINKDIMRSLLLLNQNLRTNLHGTESGQKIVRVPQTNF